METTKEDQRAEEIINYNHVRKAAIVLRALNHPLRQKIFDYLAVTGTSTVTEIINKFQLEQSVISQHLAILRRAKIISNLKTGKFVHYYINNARVIEIQSFLDSLLDDKTISRVIDIQETV